MNPPKTGLVGRNADEVVSSAHFPCLPLVVLTQRRDFQRAARGKRVAMSGFVLQMLPRPQSQQSDIACNTIRVGYTCSKKVGNAVARNRAKRRLREIARDKLPCFGRKGHDYVLIGRNTATATLPFSQLLLDLEKAIGILHGARK
jgi:ribonuclease P protein component